ncbi:hypothetical protein TNCV_1429781 [Trichonephila clavipes]|nr:hypothetical protein TNCV_1429781 [Trichonephila clavipes]
MTASCSSFIPTPLPHADTLGEGYPRGAPLQIFHTFYPLGNINALMGRPSGIVVSDADCGAVGPGFESRRRHGYL